MKALFKLFLFVILVLSLAVFSLASCNNAGGDNSESGASDDSDNGGGENNSSEGDGNTENGGTSDSGDSEGNNGSGNTENGGTGGSDEGGSDPGNGNEDGSDLGNGNEGGSVSPEGDDESDSDSGNGNEGDSDSGNGNEGGSDDFKPVEPDYSNKPTIDTGEKDDSEWWKGVKYGTDDILFQMTLCSNYDDLSSGCERYLAGEGEDREWIDYLVDKRNEDAYLNTNVNVTYQWITGPDYEYGYFKNVERIWLEVAANNNDTPDIYCNFMGDMIGATLSGCFENVYCANAGEGEYKGANYFNLTDRGYMTDYMTSLTLDPEKIYLVASDYFIDLIRAIYVVPVNISLYNLVAEDMIEDLNGDGVKDFNDLFCEVAGGGWNYGRVAEYSAKIYEAANSDTSGGEKITDTLGFILSKDPLSAAAMVYTSSVKLVSEPWNSDDFYWGYEYDENPDLVAFTEKLSQLLDVEGVMCVNYSNLTELGEKNTIVGARKHFTSGKSLFGGVTLLGALESSLYQNMKSDGGGFGIIPVPTYRESEGYFTQIHKLGKVGAISRKCDKFVQCSAFLQYQSANSSDVLNTYAYEFFTYGEKDGGLDGNVDMLELMRDNLHSGFDKFVEDAIGFLYEDTQPGAESQRWHTYLIMNNDYQISNMEGIYASAVDGKQVNFDSLKYKYSKLPESNFDS